MPEICLAIISFIILLDILSTPLTNVKNVKDVRFYHGHTHAEKLKIPVKSEVTERLVKTMFCPLLASWMVK